MRDRPLSTRFFRSPALAQTNLGADRSAIPGAILGQGDPGGDPGTGMANLLGRLKPGLHGMTNR